MWHVCGLYIVNVLCVRDGYHQQLGGCLKDFRNKPYPVRVKIEYYKKALTVRVAQHYLVSRSYNFVTSVISLWLTVFSRDSWQLLLASESPFKQNDGFSLVVRETRNYDENIELVIWVPMLHAIHGACYLWIKTYTARASTKGTIHASPTAQHHSRFAGTEFPSYWGYEAEWLAMYQGLLEKTISHPEEGRVNVGTQQ